MRNLARAAVPALLLAAACGRIDEFDVTRSATVTVPGGGGAPVPLDVIGAVELPIDRSALEQEGIDPDDVDSARLRALRIEVTQGSSLESWLDEIAFYLEAPGLPRTLVARRTGIDALPPGTNAVDLVAEDVDLKPYILAETSTVTAEASGTLPAVETTLEATATVRVDVDVSGVLF